jgi:branched-chain amino acid transport system substrate-binding protein
MYSKTLAKTWFAKLTKYSVRSVLSFFIIALSAGVITSLQAQTLKSGAKTSTNLPPIFLGQSAVMTGSTQSLGLEVRKGIEAALAEVNSKGGVKGRHLLLKSLDDQGDPKIAANNARELIKDNGVICLIGSTETAPSEAIAAALITEKIPLIGPVTGSDILRADKFSGVFHVRASYQQEVTRLAEQIAAMGMKSVAVVYKNDAFGTSNFANFEKAAQKLQIPVSATAVISNQTDINKNAATKISQSGSPVIVILSTYDVASDFIRQLRASGNAAMLISTSVIGAKALTDQLLEESRGMGMSQVMPYPWSTRTPVVSRYQNALKASGFGDKDYNYSSLEGYIAARIVIEALNKTEKNPSSQSLQATLENMGEIDLGGYSVRFSPRTREGSNFIDMTVVSATGTFLK